MKTYFLPTGLILALLLAMVFPDPGEKIASFEITSYLIAAIFFMNGHDFVLKELGFNRKLMFHVLSISMISLFLAPAIALAMSKVIVFEFYWLLGLFIIACVPTTLSSGVVITSEAGGNKSLAVMLTIVMNLLGVFVLPFTLKYLVQGSESLKIDSIALMMGLFLKVLLPFLLGLLIQKIKSTGFVFGNMLPSCLVILIVYYSSSKSQSLMMNSTIAELGLAMMISIILHLALMVLDLLYVTLSKIKREDQLAFVFCGSQKTLPLSIAVLAVLPIVPGQALVLCICYHFSQLILDSILAVYIKRQFTA